LILSFILFFILSAFFFWRNSKDAREIYNSCFFLFTLRDARSNATKSRNLAWSKQVLELLGQTVINRDVRTWESANGSIEKMRCADGNFQEPQKGCLESQKCVVQASKIWISTDIEVKVTIFVATREQTRTLFSSFSIFSFSDVRDVEGVIAFLTQHDRNVACNFAFEAIGIIHISFFKSTA